MKLICRNLDDVQVEENVFLAPFTSLRIGGKARFFTHVRSEEDLISAITFTRSNHLQAFVLGGGSNLVVADELFPGIVLKIALPQSIERKDAKNVFYFEVSAGTEWDVLVRSVCDQGICGTECMAGIPGLVGGSPIQNIGAYGQEVSQAVDAVRALDLATLNFVELGREECGFGYRTSIFNSTHKGRYIVTSVRFRFDPGARPNLTYADLASLRGTDPSPRDVYDAVRAIRDSKGMLIDSLRLRPESRSAGSFFKNPVMPASTLSQIAQAFRVELSEIPHWSMPSGEVKLSAAWLIERSGFPKGFVMRPDAPVGISPRHTLALINRSGHASCAELLELRDHLVTIVEGLIGVRLEQEPIMLG